MVAGIVALVMGTFAYLLYRNVQAMSAWPTTTGVVVASRLTHTLLDSATRKRHLALVPEVRYEYEVNGQRITASRISNRKYSEYVSSMDAPPGAELSSLLRRYPVGGSVTVRYDPQAPRLAVLEVDRSGITVFTIIAAIAAVGAVFCALRT